MKKITAILLMLIFVPLQVYAVPPNRAIIRKDLKKECISKAKSKNSYRKEYVCVKGNYGKFEVFQTKFPTERNLSEEERGVKEACVSNAKSKSNYRKEYICIDTKPYESYRPYNNKIKWKVFEIVK
jgi:hypothetical protein